jgi:hypothetical protein
VWKYLGRRDAVTAEGTVASEFLEVAPWFTREEDHEKGSEMYIS